MPLNMVSMAIYVTLEGKIPRTPRKLGMASICGKFSDDNIPNSASKKVDLF